MISMTATKTFIINGKPVEMTKEECHSKFSGLYNKNAERLQLLSTLRESAERRGERELARKYRKEYVSIKSDIDFFAGWFLKWDEA